MFIYEQEVITISQYIVGIEFIPKETSENNKIKIILPSAVSVYIKILKQAIFPPSYLSLLNFGRPMVF